MIQSDVLLHIGYHKTGTTFLQKRFFPFLAANLLIMPDVSYIATSEQYDPNDFIQLLTKQLKTNIHSLTILSQETLSGRADGNPIWDPHIIAKRLRHTFPSAKILIVIRNQFDYILSLYAFRVVRRGLEHRSLDQFLQLNHAQLRQKLQYDRLIGDYVRLFGREQVLVLPFEQLAANSFRFVTSLLNFIGYTQPVNYHNAGRENPSTRNGRLLAANRLLNKPVHALLEISQRNNWINQPQNSRFTNGYFYFKRKFLNRIGESLIPSNDVEIAIPQEWQQTAAPIFQASNTRLLNLVELDLKKWGYPL